MSVRPICMSHLFTCSDEREKDRKQLEDLSTAGATKGLHPNARDADDVDQSDESDSDGDDSDDEMEALQAELAKIRCDMKQMHVLDIGRNEEVRVSHVLFASLCDLVLVHNSLCICMFMLMSLTSCLEKGSLDIV